MEMRRRGCADRRAGPRPHRRRYLESGQDPAVERPCRARIAEHDRDLARGHAIVQQTCHLGAHGLHFAELARRRQQGDAAVVLDGLASLGLAKAALEHEERGAAGEAGLGFETLDRDAVRVAELRE